MAFEAARKGQTKAVQLMTDRRRATRYIQLNLPAKFRWHDEGVARVGEGTCRDASCKGAYIVSSTVPSVGSAVMLDLLLPNVLSGDGRGYLSGRGEVIRIDEEDEYRSGFVVSASFHLKKRLRDDRPVENDILEVHSSDQLK